MKPISIRERAINFRECGYSYGMISEKLHLNKSTLSNWLKEIPFKPNKEAVKRMKDGPAKAAQIQQEKKIKTIQIIKKQARQELGDATRRDLWFLGIGLYLGEGAKLYENVRLINSDPEIIKLSIKWFREICGLKTENFNPAVHTYPDNDIGLTVNYWSEVTGIPKNQFGKTQIDKRINKSGKKHRKLPFGTLHLQIKSCGNKSFGKNLHRRIMGWIEKVLE